jgi:hypothetical protein
MTHQNLLFIQTLFLYINAIIPVPTNVAVQYNHRSVHIPDNTAGANDRAGFIDAPDINAKKQNI